MPVQFRRAFRRRSAARVLCMRRTHTYTYRARECVRAGTRSTGIWHKADISISTGIPPTIPPRRRHGTTLSAETCIPVISLSREPRETGGVRRHREKAKDLLLPPDERRNRLEIGTTTAIRRFVSFFPHFFSSFRSHSRACVSFVPRQGKTHRPRVRPADVRSRILNVLRSNRAHLALSTRNAHIRSIMSMRIRTFIPQVVFFFFPEMESDIIPRR